MFLDIGFHKLNDLHGKAAHVINNRPISSLGQGPSPWNYTILQEPCLCSLSDLPIMLA